MILISHRGNINGKTDRENSPEYIDEAIKLGYEVEVDIWYTRGGLYLGHDFAQYEINLDWLNQRKGNLWIHCKNHPALEFLSKTDFHYFWHHDDDVTLTSKGVIWAHPKIKPLKNSVAVLPESNNWFVVDCLGVCSDYIDKYRK